VGWGPAGLYAHVVVVLTVTVCNANISAEKQTYILRYGCNFKRDLFSARPSRGLVVFAPFVLINRLAQELYIFFKF